MPTQAEIEQIVTTVMQSYPDIAARYAAGDPLIAANIKSQIQMLAEVSRDVDVSEIEPFIKSRDATILADASNKGILPLATPCQHYIEVINNGNSNISLAAGRMVEDGQGRPWRLLQSVVCIVGQTVSVLAEQSDLRTINYVAPITETFHTYKLDLDSDMDLVSLSITDNSNNIYDIAHKWMNTAVGDYACVLKTDSRRYIYVEFGDSNRYGRTLQAGTQINFTVRESFGDLDVSLLKDASLQTIDTAAEQRLTLRFKTNGLVQNGADPLSIDQMRLLASYPTYDADAVFLGNYDYLVRKNFMARTSYVSVWNETVQERNYGGSFENINKIFVAVMPNNLPELLSIRSEISNLIARADSLYDGNVVHRNVSERPYNLLVKAKLSPVHNDELVKDQIRSLLLQIYGRGAIASSYYLADGYNLRETIKILSDQIPAFQDRTSDFSLIPDDLTANPVKPHEWLYMTAESITFDISYTAGIGESRWSTL